MSMLRRSGFALVILGLLLQLALPQPTIAHVGAGWSFEYGFRADEEGTVVAGLVTNHTTARQSNIQVTATWRLGDVVVATETTTAFINSLAQHATSAFKLIEDDPVGAATLTLSVIGTPTASQPNGALGVEMGTLVLDTYTGTVTNDSDLPAQNVRVFAVRRLDGTIVDAAASATIANLAAGASAEYAIEFDDFAGTAVGSLSAETSGGTHLHTSWNNFFNDLGTTNFVDEIAWLADEGITVGCGVLRFCPKSPVTREQMAQFLNRALDLPTASEPPPFTDLAGRPAGARQAIANLYAAGLTGGCTETTFCPTAPVTRGQMSKFIVLGYQLTPIAGDGPFTDDDDHFSEPYNNRMAEDGITSGCGENTFCPLNNVLRDQMAKFLFVAEQAT